MSIRGFVLILIIFTAFVFRFQHITTVPPGLYPDEAMNGNNALEAIRTGDYKVFYPENNGREGFFINIQSLSLRVFGNEPWALRIVSALFGVFTALGVYFLAKQLFNWQIGAMASFLLAVSYWHTLFSRIGFRAIMAPFLLVWGFYFLWRGLANSRLRYFLISGVFWGLGFYTYIAFRAMPLALIITLLVYWQAIKKDFDHKKYIQTRELLIRGLAGLMVSAIIIALPIGYYFYTHPQDFLGRTGQLSIFASENPVKALGINTLKTLGIFNFIGDSNWRHNLSGEPLLFWPIGVLFLAGFFRSWIKLVHSYRKRQHFSSIHVLLLSWFIIGLLPVVLSNEGLPHALRAIILAPVVFIFAAEGLWWLADKVHDWHQIKDPTVLNIYRTKFNRSSTLAVMFAVVILTATAIFEYDKYFRRWAGNSNVPPAFAANYVEIGRKLNEMSREIKKYVLINAGGVLVNGIPMPAQTVMFITDTYLPEQQKNKNIYYLTEEQYKKGEYDKNFVIVPLEE